MRLTLIRMIPTEQIFKGNKEHQEVTSGMKLKKYEKRFSSCLFYTSNPNLLVHCYVLYWLCTCQSLLQNCK